ncbi:MAG TPA: hypothetical protein DEF59_02685 [Candidatus Magasanikbacteria bacterium]|nr:hypothetical protein [Candidatus Magasanikbacteria bacterium]
MVLWISIFSVSFAGILLLIGFKMRAIRAEKRLVLGYLDELADRNLREGISLVFKGADRVRGIVNKDNAKFVVQAIAALLLKSYVVSKTGVRKYFSRFFDAVGGKKFLNKKGAVSFFLKDILEYKKSLSKDKPN